MRSESWGTPKALLIALAAAGTFAQFLAPQASADPFKLGVEQQGYVQDPMQGSAGYQYPAPQMIRQTPMTGHAVSSPPLHAAAQQSHRPPMQAAATQVTLPPDFLGAWMVQGQRTKVEAQPEFQAAAEQAFAFNNNQIWRISGSPAQGYTLGSDTGISTQLWVDKVEGGTAFIRYQHPVKNTMAQEAIVMSLVPGGAQFNGLERISILKQGQPPRAKVTYQLIGRRQR